MIRLPLDWELIPSLNVPTMRTVRPESSETCPASELAEAGLSRELVGQGGVRLAQLLAVLPSPRCRSSTSSSSGTPITQIRSSDPSRRSRQ